MTDKIRAIDVIKDIVEKEGLTYTELASRLDLDRRTIDQYLNRTKNDLKVNVFSDMLDAMGYELMVVKKGLKK